MPNSIAKKMLWTLGALDFPPKNGIMHSAVQTSLFFFFLLADQRLKTAKQGLLQTRPSTIRSEGGIARFIHKVSCYLVQIARSSEQTCRSRENYWLDCCPCRCKHRHQPLSASHSSIIPKKLSANPDCLLKSNRQ